MYVDVAAGWVPAVVFVTVCALMPMSFFYVWCHVCIGAVVLATRSLENAPGPKGPWESGRDTMMPFFDTIRENLLVAWIDTKAGLAFM